ncbi:hypothetical protein HMPREF0063_10481 [Aeromicrobium marinum DSM 15272]|uniref:Polysaccharide pyruvyl transferase domain-containing protein n=1 Tax=Aeromicrobium marinum DSM 15272 TaxID=585531 RepID=E2S8X3_9ACTN|nr:polysaccharide pyruvyl transferase family protein [Aeromicrobium marinum]EFQ84628.1 hypothetical protein HMPREF0063_10481 [Aeromicrobium marinum DSM 15272]
MRGAGRSRRRRPPRRLYLIGVAGHPNFGDEAITRGWLRWLAKREPDAEVWLDVPNPGNATALHHGLHPGLRCVDTLHRLAWEAPGDDPRGVGAHVTEVLDRPWVSPRWTAGVEAFRSADVVHLLGGGYVNSGARWSAGLVAAAAWAAPRGARTGGTGLGLLPADAALREVWAAAAPSFDVLAVRDHASVAVTGGVAEQSPDDIFLGGVGQHTRRDGDRLPRVMVLAQRDTHDRFDDVVATVRATLDGWQVDPADVGFAECNPPVDFGIVEALRGQYPDAPFYAFPEVLREGLPAAAHQTWITTRYHPHLIAASAGAAGAAISVSEDYYGVKHEAVVAAGSGWTVAAPGGQAVQPGPAGELVTRAVTHTRALEALAQRLYR